MKKFTVSFLAVLLLLMLASCKTIGNFGNTADFNSDQFLERYDHDRVWMHIIPTSCRADNVICFTSPTLSNSPYIQICGSGKRLQRSLVREAGVQAYGPNV